MNLSTFPQGHSAAIRFFGPLNVKQLRLNVTADQTGYTRIAELFPIYAAVQSASNSTSPPSFTLNVASDSIHLAREVAYRRDYSRCSWRTGQNPTCHVYLFLVVDEEAKEQYAYWGRGRRGLLFEL